MNMRMQRADIDKILDELWTRFEADIAYSETLQGTYEDLFNETYEDGRACKYCLDTLRWCKLITDDECSEWALKVDRYIEAALDNKKNKTA